MQPWGWYLAEPIYLWLLLLLGGLLLGWLARLVQRRIKVQRLIGARSVPLKEKFYFFGPWLFWFFVIMAAGCLVLALARPQKLMAVSQIGGVDLVIIQDGSASIWTKDVLPSRWERSVVWMNTLVETLAWNGDRVALTLFAHWAAPQIRFSKDPNVILFFLDHLRDHSPIPLGDNTAWDTNLQEGIYWALKVSAKDKETASATGNGLAFVVISDGQVWSGKVGEALAEVRKRNIPVHVIGVGTTAGGRIPYNPKETWEIEQGKDFLNVHSAIDRASLQEVAREGGGKYFELNRESDRQIAMEIIRATRMRSANKKEEKVFADLYWYFLCAAAAILGMAVIAIREKIELWMLVIALCGIVAGLVMFVK